MKSLLIFLIIPAAMALHIVLAMSFGLYERIPFIPFALMGISLFALGRALTKNRPLSKGLVALNAIGWLLAGSFAWWTLIYSAFDEIEETVALGGDVTELSTLTGLVDEQGTPFSFTFDQSSKASGTLLVFYRGHW